MTPKKGRPIVGAEPRNRQIAVRATATTVRKLTECSMATGKTKTDLVEEMVDRLHLQVCKK